MKSTWILGLVLVLSGLSNNLRASHAVGKDYSRPETPGSEHFNDSDPGTWKEATPTDAIAHGDWWRVFNDPVLNQLEADAALNNQDVKAAIARVTQARALARTAKADFFPALNFIPSATRGRMSENLLNPLPNQLGNDFR